MEGASAESEGGGEAGHSFLFFVELGGWELLRVGGGVAKKTEICPKVTLPLIPSERRLRVARPGKVGN